MNQTLFHGIGLFSTGLTAFLLMLTVLTMAGTSSAPKVAYATNSTQSSGSGVNPSLGGSENTKSLSSSAHCDRPGYPSCSSLGFQAGKSAPGTSCPPGHSKAFCNAYKDAAGNTSSNNNNNNNNQPGQSPQPQSSISHCDRSGYPVCYSLGYADGGKHPGISCPPNHTPNYCAGWNAAAGNIIHCDHPGWPSCYSLGYNAGKSAPGTSCPPGHSQAFCNGYEYASGGNGRGYIQGVADPTYCDQPGFPACYDLGYHNGYNNAVNEHHQFHNSCPLGHSKAFCNGYGPGYNQGIKYNIGYSQGVKNADQDWNLSDQDIHAFTYDCPTGHTKDFCNGYTDGYGDEVNDILG